MARVQKDILKNAAKMLKSGGCLVYCTCSLQKEEGEHQIDQFLADHPDFRRLPITTKDIAPHNADSFITPQGDVRILPYMDPLSPSSKYTESQTTGMDGFFISRLIRD